MESGGITGKGSRAGRPLTADHDAIRLPRSLNIPTGQSTCELFNHAFSAALAAMPARQGYIGSRAPPPMFIAGFVHSQRACDPGKARNPRISGQSIAESRKIGARAMVVVERRHRNARMIRGDWLPVSVVPNLGIRVAGVEPKRAPRPFWGLA